MGPHSYNSRELNCANDQLRKDLGLPRAWPQPVRPLTEDPGSCAPAPGPRSQEKKRRDSKHAHDPLFHTQMKTGPVPPGGTLGNTISVQLESHMGAERSPEISPLDEAWLIRQIHCLTAGANLPLWVRCWLLTISSLPFCRETGISPSFWAPFPQPAGRWPLHRNSELDSPSMAYRPRNTSSPRPLVAGLRSGAKEGIHEGVAFLSIPSGRAQPSLLMALREVATPWRECTEGEAPRADPPRWYGHSREELVLKG